MFTTNEMEEIKIAVAGTGYVGLSMATLLSQNHDVTAVDVIPEKVDKINRRISPIQDEYIEKFFAEKTLRLTATLDGATAYKDADFVIIAAPTNYDPVKNFFDTHCIEDVIDLVLGVNPDAVMVIKSTIPVGYCRSLYIKYAAKGVKKLNLLFSPEFLRESKALYDNLYPSPFCFRQNFCASLRHCTTISIRRESSSAFPKSSINPSSRMRTMPYNALRT